MDYPRSRPVTVCVNGDNHAALRFAVAEARRTDSSLRIVHAAEFLPRPTSSPLIAAGAYSDVAHRVVARATAFVQDEFGNEPAVAQGIEGFVLRGRPTRALLDESTSARCLVLEHRDLSRAARVLTGSTSIGVAARAECPVFSVPEGWTETQHGLVVVGVDERGGPVDVLREGLTQAAERGTPLTVLHAWRLPGAYTDLGDERMVEQAWRDGTLPELRAALARLADDFPTVKATIEMTYSFPVEALMSASEQADLLVLGRRARRGPLRIGSLARSLVRVARCPVLVTPVPERALQDEGWDGDSMSPQT